MNGHLAGARSAGKRTLGSTGLRVSSIGFGASPLGDVFGSVTVEDGRAAVHHAIDSGINLFDVSPYYGLTLAEERLGAALAGRRHEVVLATKCGRYGADDFDFSAAKVTQEFESSLRRLQTDYVDLLQVHDVEFGSVDQILHETLPALRRLQQQGKARFIGITGYWPHLLARIARAAPVDTVLNYCHANLLMDDMDRELAPLAAQLGFGLMNASPLHMGLLSGQPVPEWHPAPSGNACVTCLSPESRARFDVHRIQERCAGGRRAGCARLCSARRSDGMHSRTGRAGLQHSVAIGPCRESA